MKDRIPTYPGRVKLTPVPGTTDLFDLTMADQPTEAGTPLSKASLLTDTVAAAIATLTGTAAPETPNEAISKITDIVQTAYNNRVRIQTGSYVGTGTSGSDNPSSLSFDFPPSLLVFFEVGVVTAFLNSYMQGVAVCSVLGLTTSYQGQFIGYSRTYNGYYYAIYGKRSEDSKTIDWYTTDGSYLQMNAVGRTYHYIAIG